MEYILSAEEMKQCDAYTIDELGVPSMVLMERAALSVVSEIKRHDFNLSRVLVVCGSGNNGGDGFAIARLLAEQESNVEIVFAGNEAHLSPQTKKQWEIADKYQIPVNRTIEEKAYTIVVDALFGIGLNRELSETYQQLIGQMNAIKEKGAKLIAVDISSGIDADSGKVMGAAVMADLTVTFAFKKTGQLLYPGAFYTGELIKKEIGITNRSLTGNYMVSAQEKTDLFKLKRPAYSNKGTFGKALLIVGSEAMAGAAILAARACFKSGTGMVQVITHEKNRDLLMESLPEAIVTVYGTEPDEDKIKKALDWADIIGIGPGLSQSETAERLLELVVRKSQKPLVIDADAITLLAKQKSLLETQNERTLIMTPHIGEFCRFTQLSKEAVLDDLIAATAQVAENYGLVCVCKDARTVIADRTGKIRLNTTGNSGMATAGTGDVLFGIICGLLAQGLSAFDAASMGVYLHGCSGDAAAKAEGEHGMLAGDLIDAMKNFLG